MVEFIFYLKSEPIRFPFSGSPGSGHKLDACLIPPSFAGKKKTKQQNKINNKKRRDYIMKFLENTEVSN